MKETWDEIEEEYGKDEYPPFGGPFTNALSIFEWLKLHYHPPVRKIITNQRPLLKADELIIKHYYALPNNGSINTGDNSCDNRWKQATQCALITIDEVLANIEPSQSPDDIKARIKYWHNVKHEIEK